jgi:high affinity Mn2+ porin
MVLHAPQRCALTVLILIAAGMRPAQAQEEARWNAHEQFTGVLQYHPQFTSPYAGANSLDPGNAGKETADATAYLGLRLTPGIDGYADPEIDQGYGLSNTVGIAGFPSGEAYKVGARNPNFRLPRAFVRAVIDLSDDTDGATLADGPNQLARRMARDNVVVTAGKFSVVDVFDANVYAHDARNDFMNWSVIDAGAFDYAADAWGFTYGAAAEWTRGWWTLRGGAFALSKVPNGKDIDGHFGQFSLVTEAEERHHWMGRDGSLKALLFLNRGRMGRYEDALAQAGGAAPSTAAVRRTGSHSGASLNLQQELASDLGMFARASANTGDVEAYEFTEINRSVSAGLRASGAAWGRDADALGLATAVNALSSPAQRYLAAGGMGILIGDGRLPHAGREAILETYYAAHLAGGFTGSFDYQYVRHPAYNTDRGPVSVFALRVHADF